MIMFIPNKSILFLLCLIGVFILNGNANPVHKRHRTRSTTVETSTDADQSSITTSEDDNDDDLITTPEDDNNHSTATKENDIDENDLTTPESSEDLITTLPNDLSSLSSIIDEIENDLTSIPSLIPVSLPEIDDNDDITIGPIVIDV